MWDVSRRRSPGLSLSPGGTRPARSQQTNKGASPDARARLIARMRARARAFSVRGCARVLASHRAARAPIAPVRALTSRRAHPALRGCATHPILARPSPAARSARGPASRSGHLAGFRPANGASHNPRRSRLRSLATPCLRALASSCASTRGRARGRARSLVSAPPIPPLVPHPSSLASASLLGRTQSPRPSIAQ